MRVFQAIIEIDGHSVGTMLVKGAHMPEAAARVLHNYPARTIVGLATTKGPRAHEVLESYCHPAYPGTPPEGVVRGASCANYIVRRCNGEDARVVHALSACSAVGVFLGASFGKCFVGISLADGGVSWFERAIFTRERGVNGESVQMRGEIPEEHRTASGEFFSTAGLDVQGQIRRALQTAAEGLAN